MKKHWKTWMARLREPRWRHGKLNALLMAAFLTVCVLLNVAVKVLEDEYGWKKDLSFNRYATTGEETAEVLRQLTYDVELYLLYQNGSIDSQVLNLLDRYAVLSDCITVLPTDIVKNPGVLSRFQGTLDNAIEADTVIVHCPETGRYKILTYADFITQGYNIEQGAFEIEGLAYEKKLTEAIVYTAQSRVPTIGFLQGHAELDEGALTVFRSYLTSNNYDTRFVNLLSGDLLDEVDMLVFAAPQKDLSDAEVDMISDFARKGGSLLVMRDYTDPLDTMPNYLALLRSYGIIPMEGVVVAGAQDTGSYYEEQLNLLPYMTELDMTLPLLNAGMDVLLLPAATAFETPAAATESLSAATLLKTGPNAYVRSLSDGVVSIEQQPGDVSGEISVGVFAHRMFSDGNISRAVAIGNSAMFINEYIYQRTFNEEFLLMLLGELVPDKTVSLDIMASAALRPALTVGSKAIGLALTAAIPLLVIIAGLCVLLPRKNR